MASGTRERIVRAGLELFLRSGFAHVGLDQVVKQAGLTKTTFYNHFESKEELVRAVITAREIEVTRSLSEAVARRADAPARERLLAVVDAFDESFREGTTGRCLLLSAVVEFPNTQDPTNQLATTYREARCDFLRSIAHAAGIQDTEAFVARFTILIDGATISWQVNRRHDAAQQARPCVAQLVDSFLNGATSS